MANIHYSKIIETMAEYVDFDQFDVLLSNLTDSIKSIIEMVNDDFNLFKLLKLTEEALGHLQELINYLVVIVEKVHKEMGGFDNSKKKALLKFLDDQIELPFFFEWVDNKVLGSAIDASVEFFNEQYGHQWDNFVEK